MTITIAHHFNRNRVYGGTTIAYMREGVDLVHIGVSICDVKDRYVKKVGAALATKRLNERKAGYTVLDLSTGRSDVVEYLGHIILNHTEDITNQHLADGLRLAQEQAINDFLKVHISNNFIERMVRRHVDVEYGYGSDTDSVEIHRLYQK